LAKILEILDFVKSTTTIQDKTGMLLQSKARRRDEMVRNQKK
jgi:hypothetical protein